MKNPIDCFDDGIMYCANKGVRAWNWSTGKGKTDLANKMLSVAVIGESGGTIYALDAPGLAMIPVYLADIITRKKNREQENREKNSGDGDFGIRNIEDEFRNIYLGISKLAYGVFGSAGLSYLAHFCSPNSFNETIGFSILGTSLVINGLSHYVMRADEPPYSKSRVPKFAKGLKDKVAEKVGDFVPLPLPEPVPISVEARGLEDLV